jgi:predicted RNA-binding Zn ribbon-like protein
VAGSRRTSRPHLGVAQDLERAGLGERLAPTATDTVLGVIAADTIELLGGPRSDDLRACGAPGCMLMFLKDHPRREWCSPTCGNRARQARHYARSRAQRS